MLEIQNYTELKYEYVIELESVELNYSYVRYSDTVLHMNVYGSNVVSGGAKRPAGNATRLEVSPQLGIY